MQGICFFRSKSQYLPPHTSLSFISWHFESFYAPPLLLVRVCHPLQRWQGCNWYLGSHLSCELSLKPSGRNQLSCCIWDGFFLLNYLLCPAHFLLQAGMSCSLLLSPTVPCQCKTASFWPQACMCTAAVLTVLVWAPYLTGMWPVLVIPCQQWPGWLCLSPSGHMSLVRARANL